jgi:hypothetical protein
MSFAKCHYAKCHSAKCRSASQMAAFTNLSHFNVSLFRKKTESPLSHFFILISLSCVFLFPGPNVIKLFTAVIYCHSMAIPSFCVIKQHYFGNYCRVAVNYLGICVTNVIKHNLTLNGKKIYCIILTLEKVGLKLLW